MKKLISVIIMIAMLFSFAACGVSKDSIKPAVYRLEDMQYPRLSLKKDMTFRLVYTADASHISKGTYSVSEGILHLVADDGEEYNFVIEKDAVVFDGATSDAFVKVHSNEPDMPDGTVFEFWREYK